MKSKIHPKYNTNTKVICACGNTFDTGSTIDEIKTELCSACHPFYTGKQKLVDSARRVEKFEAKIKAKDASKDKLGKKVKRAARDLERAKKEIKMKMGDEDKKTVSKKKIKTIKKINPVKSPKKDKK